MEQQSRGRFCPNAVIRKTKYIELKPLVRNLIEMTWKYLMKILDSKIVERDWNTFE